MIAFDTSSKGGDAVTTWSHTCTGANRLLVVAVSDTNYSCTGVTYNGVAMTLAGTPIDGRGQAETYLFYMINPPAGAYNIVLQGGFFSSAFTGEAASYTGVGALDATNKGSDADTSTTVAVTVVASNCWLVGAGWGYGTASTNRTQRQSQSFAFGLQMGQILDSNGTVGTGSQSAQFNSSNGIGSAGVLASFSPYVAPLNRGHLSLLGVA